ncbi:unnamed protein product [Protopolystoma xenopodis]|uniref:EF-hand domain-containing protein n=1 Tax=Protopolystoma xenopodis TaxID=117903 RepID=A0A448XNW5_9PLAT|nr:unnamed protein product [Protopolystoma xenopodis]
MILPITCPDLVPNYHALANAQLTSNLDIILRTVCWAEANQLLSAQFNLPASTVRQIWLLADLDGDSKLTQHEYCIAAHLACLHSAQGVQLPSSKTDLLVFLISQRVRENKNNCRQATFRKTSSPVNELYSSASIPGNDSYSSSLIKHGSPERPLSESSFTNLYQFSPIQSTQIGSTKARLGHSVDAKTSYSQIAKFTMKNEGHLDIFEIEDRMTRSASSAMLDFKPVQTVFDLTDDPMIPFVYDSSDDEDDYTRPDAQDPLGVS